MLSAGPVELLFLACCVACFVSCSEIETCVSCSFRFFLSMTVVVRRRVFCCVSELFVEALGFLCICGSVERVKLDCGIVSLCGFLLFSAAIVFQSLCVLLRWSQLSVRCSLQSCCLCSCIILFILLFSGASCGSVEFCFRAVFLVSMAALMFSGRSFCLLSIITTLNTKT